MKKLVFENAQICNKIDTLEGSIETASATALFYLEKDVSSYKKGVSLIFRGYGRKKFPGDSAPYPILLSSFKSYGTSTLSMTGWHWALEPIPLLISKVTLQASCPSWLPSSWPLPLPLFPMATSFLPPPKMRPWVCHW